MKYLVFILCFMLFGCSQKEKMPNISYQKTSIEGEKILNIGEIMALRDKEIIQGGCWDYINTLYNRAGFSKDDRIYIYKGSKKRGTLAPLHLIKAGDWLYFINHSYSKMEHSGVFVRWIDRGKNQALLLSYQGEFKKKPARYKTYDITNTYTIIRAKPQGLHVRKF